MLHKTLIEKGREEKRGKKKKKMEKSKTWNPFTGFRSVPIISGHDVSNWPPVKRNQRLLQPGRDSQLERLNKKKERRRARSC
jgi:hypothetical protein